MKKRIILFIELSTLFLLILLDKLVENILNNNNLELRNLPQCVLLTTYIVLLFLIIIQLVYIIYSCVKNYILKAIIIIISIIAICIYGGIVFFGIAFSSEPEHIVEKDDKKMVACVDSFLEVRVYYYDYVNSFVRGNKAKLYEDYGDGGYDPFEIDENITPKRSIYYDDDGNMIKNTES